MRKLKKFALRLFSLTMCLICFLTAAPNWAVVAVAKEESIPITNEDIAEALSNATFVDSEDENDELISEQSDNGIVTADDELAGDDMVNLTQKWLNRTYGYEKLQLKSPITENGKTGWPTIHALTRALQYELGIKELADNFGDKTKAEYAKHILQKGADNNENMCIILIGALWCKGYNPGHSFRWNKVTGAVTANAEFDTALESAIIRLKTDAGLTDPDGVVTVNTMKALMSMDRLFCKVL